MIALLLTLGAMAPATPSVPTYSWQHALGAIQRVETGGCANGGIGAKGDGGRALGPLQIHAIYHTDAAGVDKTLSDYRRCLMSRSYSERVVRAYMSRYARAALRRLESGAGTLADIETVARIHNGGPRANRAERLKFTDGYWAKIKKAVR